MEGASPIYGSRWVYFPKMVENCGTIKRQAVGQVPCSGISCGPSYVPASVCTGDVEIIDNVCTVAPAIGDDGEAMVYYVLRKLFLSSQLHGHRLRGYEFLKF